MAFSEFLILLLHVDISILCFYVIIEEVPSNILLSILMDLAWWRHLEKRNLPSSNNILLFTLTQDKKIQSL